MSIEFRSQSPFLLLSKANTWTAKQLYDDDIILGLGAGGDQAFLNRSTALAADTALTSVLIGTPVSGALAANSLIISNITASGDVAFYGNRGGNSEQFLFMDVSAGVMYLTPTQGGMTIGLTADAPAPTLADSVHIWAGASGGNQRGDCTLVLEDSATELYMQFLSPSNAGEQGFAFGDADSASAGSIRYDHDDTQLEFIVETANVVNFTTTALSLPVAGYDLDINAGYVQLSEMSAPGAGAANHVRIYAVPDGGGLTDLAAVFQDGTIDIFAQEVTPLDHPIFRYPSGTEGTLRMRKPHPGIQIFEMVFPDGTTMVLREFEHHDSDKIAASQGSEGSLPVGWLSETAAQRASRAALEGSDD